MKTTVDVERKTKETEIRASLALRGAGNATVSTGFGFLDHMLTSLAKHSGIDLEIEATGDTHVDDHHTVEDCAIVIGRGIDEALEDRSGVARFGSAYAPMDEALCRAVVDLSGRGAPLIDIPFTRETVGDVATENLIHFLNSLALEARMSLHVDLIRGQNNHHIAEAAFKSVALALRTALSPVADIASTKGVLG